MNKFPEQKEIIRWMERWRKATSPRSKTIWGNRILRAEERLRKTANSRIRRLRESGFDVGEHGFLWNWIDQKTGDSYKNYLRSPKGNVYYAYTQLLIENQFIQSETSTIKGIKSKLKTEEGKYRIIGVDFNTFQEAQEYLKWRNSKPITEFFSLFPPSPEDLATKIGSDAIDIYMAGDKHREMLNDYINAYLKERNRSFEGFTPEISATDVRQYLADYITTHPEIRRRNR